MQFFVTEKTVTHHIVESRADQCAKEETHEDIAEIVDAEVQPRPTVEEAPGGESDSRQSLAEEESEIDSDAGCIGGVAGEEPITATPISLHHVYHFME